jgi:hypothetical protein
LAFLELAGNPKLSHFSLSQKERICNDKSLIILSLSIYYHSQGTDGDQYALNVTKKWQPLPTCSEQSKINRNRSNLSTISSKNIVNTSDINANTIRNPVTESDLSYIDDKVNHMDDDHTNAIDGASRGKVTTRSMGSESMSLSSVSSTFSRYSTKLCMLIAGLLVYSSRLL